MLAAHLETRSAPPAVAPATRPPSPSRLAQRGKPAGINAGRKLMKHRKIERWASKVYSKAHSITHLKANPLLGASMGASASAATRPPPLRRLPVLPRSSSAAHQPPMNAVAAAAAAAAAARTPSC